MAKNMAVVAAPHRADRRERIPLRIDRVTYRKIKVAAQKHDTSMNSLIYAMIRYCQNSADFNNVHLEEQFPRDMRDGFYTYHPGEDDQIQEHVRRR